MTAIRFGSVVRFNVLTKIYHVIKHFAAMIAFHGGVFFCPEMNFFVFLTASIAVKFLPTNTTGKRLLACVNSLVFSSVVDSCKYFATVTTLQGVINRRFRPGVICAYRLVVHLE